MTQEQQELLAAAVLLSLRNLGQSRYSGKFVDLAVAVQDRAGNQFGAAQILEAIEVLSQLGAGSLSSHNASFISVDVAKAEAAFARVGNDRFNPRKRFPLLYEYVQFGEDWLRSIWPDYFPSEEHAGGGLETPPAIEENVGILAPAADRIVRLNHNQILEYEAPINELVLELERDNGKPDEPGLRDRLLGQIRAGRELIHAGEFRAHLLYVTLVRALAELIERYGNPTIKALANALLGAIVSQLFQAN